MSMPNRLLNESILAETRRQFFGRGARGLEIGRAHV